MHDDTKLRHARSFGAATDAYVAGRPSYPAEAIAWAVPDAATDVVDVGAGTGKLTAGLVRPGRRVTAVEPDAAMLSTLREQVAGVVAVEGTGEHIPLPDDSADVVTFGQSWHWVDPVIAAPEVARVLRPGGRMSLLWNIRDGSVPWVAELTRIMRGSDAEGMIDAGGPQTAVPFGEFEAATFSWAMPTTPDGILAMAASRSYIITATQVDRDEILGGIRNLLATDPQTAGRDHFDLPYVTHVYRAHVR